MRKIGEKSTAIAIRVPEVWDDWVRSFAKRYDVPVANVYRAAVRDFIKKQDPDFIAANPIDKK